MKYNYDIQIKGNSIGGRQGWAYICNSMEVTVLNTKVTATDVAGYGEWKQLCNVKLHEVHKNRDNYYDGELEIENGKFKIGGHGACLSSRFGYTDALELATAANYPVVTADKVVAVVLDMQDTKSVAIKLYKIGRIDPFCMTMTHLEPLTDEEMQEVKTKAVRWLNR